MLAIWNQRLPGGRARTTSSATTRPQATGGAPANESSVKAAIPIRLPVMSSR